MGPIFSLDLPRFSHPPTGSLRYYSLCTSHYVDTLCILTQYFPHGILFYYDKGRTNWLPEARMGVFFQILRKRRYKPTLIISVSRDSPKEKETRGLSQGRC